jgi:AcrR family transcriptional regulator
VTDVAEPRARSDFHERLLEGLANSIREKGLHGTQISDIVRHARTSRRTFYECFSDKESCFLALIEASNTAILEAVRAAVDPAAEWTVQVDQAVDSYLGALALDPALIVTISRDLPTLGTRGASFLHESVERYAQLIVEITRSASPQAGGRATISLEEAVMLAGGVGEILDRAVARGDDVRSIAPVVKSVIKAVLDPERRF